MSTLRDEVWHILNDPEDQRYGLFLGFITILIFLSVGLLLYETFFLPEVVASCWHALYIGQKPLG